MIVMIIVTQYYFPSGGYLLSSKTVFFVVLAVALTASAADLPCSKMSLGVGANLNGYRPLSDDSLWNVDISNWPVDPRSKAVMNFIGPTGLHPDFGSGTWQGHILGIPYVVVSGQKLIPVESTLYPTESDPGPMPIPLDTPMQGAPTPDPGTDRHIIALDRDTCREYDLWQGFAQPDGTWKASSTAYYDMLKGDNQRPWTWTSANAGGVPEFVGLVRYDEVASGEIHHALAFTLLHSSNVFTPPAHHPANMSKDAIAPPMGVRFRLRADYDISGFSPQVQVILRALKHYGMILVDNGIDMYLSGAPDPHWNNDDLAKMKRITTADFEMMPVFPIYSYQHYPKGPPLVNGFVASPSSGPGTPVTLSWNVADGGYIIISGVGPVTGHSVKVEPAATTTYTLTATNSFGRATASVTVTVGRPSPTPDPGKQ